MFISVSESNERGSNALEMTESGTDRDGGLLACMQVSCLLMQLLQGVLSSHYPDGNYYLTGR